MKAICGTRKQSLIFLVPDALAERFEAGEMYYDELWEELDHLASEPTSIGIIDNGDFLVYASTEEADLDRVMQLKEVNEHTDLRHPQFKNAVSAIKIADNMARKAVSK